MWRFPLSCTRIIWDSLHLGWRGVKL